MLDRINSTSANTRFTVHETKRRELCPEITVFSGDLRAPMINFNSRRVISHVPKESECNATFARRCPFALPHVYRLTSNHFYRGFLFYSSGNLYVTDLDVLIYSRIVVREIFSKDNTGIAPARHKAIPMRPCGIRRSLK